MLTASPLSPTTSTASLLTMENIEVAYDNVVLVLRGVSLHVPKGQIVTLLGPNGAGKSTTLKSISGLLRSENGRKNYPVKAGVTFATEKGNQRVLWVIIPASIELRDCIMILVPYEDTVT